MDRELENTGLWIKLYLDEGFEPRVDKAIEENGELIIELEKYKPDITKLVDEMADILMMIESIEAIEIGFVVPEAEECEHLLEWLDCFEEELTLLKYLPIKKKRENKDLIEAISHAKKGISDLSKHFDIVSRVNMWKLAKTTKLREEVYKTKSRINTKS